MQHYKPEMERGAGYEVPSEAVRPSRRFTTPIRTLAIGLPLLAVLGAGACWAVQQGPNRLVSPAVALATGTPERLSLTQVAATVIEGNPTVKAAIKTAEAQRTATIAADRVNLVLGMPVVRTALSGPLPDALNKAVAEGKLDPSVTPTPAPKLTVAQVASTAINGSEERTNARNKLWNDLNQGTAVAFNQLVAANPTIQAISSKAAGTAIAQASREGRLDLSTATSIGTATRTATRTAALTVSPTFTVTVGSRTLTVTTSPSPTATATRTPTPASRA